MKKFLLFFVAMLLFVSQEILAGYTFYWNGIKYEINSDDTTVSVVKNSGITGEIVIPNTVRYGKEYSVTSIGVSAFEGCTGLTSIEIPSGVTSIGSYAFSGCIGLTSIEIPSSVRYIEDNAFSGCTGITSVHFNAEDCFYMTSFEDCPIDKFTFGESVKVIPDWLCYGMNRLTSIEIPSNVTSIGKDAFNGCTGLISITIQNGVTTIKEEAFKECSSLESIEIPGSVMSIGNRAFSGCSSLTSVTIHHGVNEFGCSMFIGCSSLESLEIPGSVTSMDYAFKDCTNFISIKINKGVKKIDLRAFEGCSGLESIEIPSSVTEISYEAFDGCSNLKSIIIPNSVTTIYDSAFEGCSSLESIVIPNGVTTIWRYVFYGCSGLKSIIIPNSVTTIQDGAFKGCSGLESIEIPNSVTEIWSDFDDCSGLKYVRCYATVPPTPGGIFDKSIPIYVPCNSLNLYKKSNYWKNLNIKCDEAKHIDEPLDDVVITPSDTKVVVAWPVVNNASNYVFEIKKGNATFCIITFNNKGQLLSIEYPSSSKRMAEVRSASSTYGYQYSITGLTPETTYKYTIKALDNNERTLSLKSGSFTTTSEPVSADEQSAEPEFKDKVYVQDKNIMIEGLSSDDYSIYNTTGKQVSNPVPASGVYVVKVGDEAMKVMVK